MAIVQSNITGRSIFCGDWLNPSRYAGLWTDTGIGLAAVAGSQDMRASISGYGTAMKYSRLAVFVQPNISERVYEKVIIPV
jgi:hypothetical protein